MVRHCAKYWKMFVKSEFIYQSNVLYLFDLLFRKLKRLKHAYLINITFQIFPILKLNSSFYDSLPNRPQKQAARICNTLHFNAPVAEENQ